MKINMKKVFTRVRMFRGSMAEKNGGLLKYRAYLPICPNCGFLISIYILKKRI